MNNLIQPKLLRDVIKLDKGKPPAQQGYYGPDATLYLTPDYLRGGAQPEHVKPSSNAVHVKDGETIVLWDGSNAGEIFRSKQGVLASTMARVIHSEDYDSNYFFFALKGWEGYLKGQTSGSGIPHVDKEVLGKLTLFEFPKPEQSKIAEVLSKVEQAIKQTESLIAKQQRIKTGLMQDLLTKGIDEHGKLRSEEAHEFKNSPLGRIPVEWEVEELGKVIGPIVSGWSPTCDHAPAAIGEWGILKTTACVWSGYDQNENKRLPLILRGLSKIEVVTDDILITRKGPVDRVGVVVHIPETRSKLMIPDTVFKMRLNADSNVFPAFLPIALGSAAVQSDWFQKKIGLADAQVNLNHSILRTTFFPKPSYFEQTLIVDVLKKANEKIQEGFEQVEKLQSLKTALMQDLLTGKKRVTPLMENMEVCS